MDEAFVSVVSCLRYCSRRRDRSVFFLVRARVEDGGCGFVILVGLAPIGWEVALVVRVPARVVLSLCLVRIAFSVVMTSQYEIHVYIYTYRGTRLDWTSAGNKAISVTLTYRDAWF